MMMHTKSQSGFSLVELAVVITIIGILIGAVLKGQQLVKNSQLTATIAQVSSYESAMNTFRKTFSELPGDMVNPDGRLPDCSGCTATGEGTPGDGRVGTGDAGTDAQGDKNDEAVLFWTHLLKVNMITGVSDAALTSDPVIWGNTHPRANINDLGFASKYSNGACNSRSRIWVSYRHNGCSPKGHVFILQRLPDYNLYDNANTSALSPFDAAQIDRKIDDGKSRTGYVVAASNDDTCDNGGPDDTTYNESSTNKPDCALAFIAK